MIYSVATLKNHASWLRARARKVDLENGSERDLSKDLSNIMEEVCRKKGWIGASSNNIFWDATTGPISLIYVPHSSRKENITIINPEVRDVKGEALSIECCGSVPRQKYVVERQEDLIVSGYVLERDFKKVFLPYSLNETLRGKEFLYMTKETPIFILQHELDHLEGKLICDQVFF